MDSHRFDAGAFSTRGILFVLAFSVVALFPASNLIAQQPFGPPPPPRAGDISRDLVVRVTGDNVPRSLYVSMVKKRIQQALAPAPGANFGVAWDRLTVPASVSRGNSGLARVPVSFWGAGFTGVNTEAVVRIDNVILQDFDRSSRLYVSNNPESLARPGTLLRGSVDQFENVRVLYHHKNISAEVYDIAFYIKNVSDVPVRIQLMGSDPQVSRREMSAGHRAAAQFAKNLKKDLGRIIDLPPGGDGPVFDAAFEPGEIVSGVFELRVLEGPGVVFALHVRRASDPTDGDGIEIGNSQGRRGHGEFPAAYLTLDDEFVVGGRWKFLGVGDQALNGVSATMRPLAGNYGVTYRMRVTLRNPHERKELVDLKLAPVSGPAGAIVYVDGRPHDIVYAKQHDQVRLESFELPPNGTREVTVETMPESGSFYPIRIVFGARRIL